MTGFTGFDDDLFRDLGGLKARLEARSGDDIAIALRVRRTLVAMADDDDLWERFGRRSAPDVPQYGLDVAYLTLNVGWTRILDGIGWSPPPSAGEFVALHLTDPLQDALAGDTPTFMRTEQARRGLRTLADKIGVLVGDEHTHGARNRVTTALKRAVIKLDGAQRNRLRMLLSLGLSVAVGVAAVTIANDEVVRAVAGGGLSFLATELQLKVNWIADGSADDLAQSLLSVVRTIDELEPNPDPAEMVGRCRAWAVEVFVVSPMLSGELEVVRHTLVDELADALRHPELTAAAAARARQVALDAARLRNPTLVAEFEQAYESAAMLKAVRRLVADAAVAAPPPEEFA